MSVSGLDNVITFGPAVPRVTPRSAPSVAVLVTPRAPDHAELCRLVEDFEVVVIAHDAAVAATLLQRLAGDTRDAEDAGGAGAGPADPPGVPIVLDAARHLASLHGRELPFTRRERTILGCLLDAPGCVLTYADLFERAWGSHYLGDPSLVHSALKRIRRKLRDAGSEMQIDAVRGVGFRTC